MDASLSIERKSALPLWAIIPGVVYIVIVDLVTVAGIDWIPRQVIHTWTLVIAVIPWATLLVIRQPPSLLGYTRYRAVAEIGWGMLAGAIWRGLSMLFNLWWQGGWTNLGWGVGSWLLILVWIPLVEETFFRGYIGRTLASRLGKRFGIIVQAILFSLHPGHWVQGWLHIFSIFIFGLLAGWLVQNRDSIWAAWGAHGFANVLPEIIIKFA